MQSHYPSPHHKNVFRNPYPGFAPRGFKDFLQWQRDRRNGKAPSKSRQYHFSAIENDGAMLRQNHESFAVTWIGHSTTLIQIAGRNILTDPIFSERCSPVLWSGPKRVTAPSPRFDHLPRIDFVLLSHDHYDHLDKPAIKKILAIHWGTFDLADEPLDEPLQLLRAAADSLSIDPARIWIFQLGETRRLDENIT